jgi:hypothetical protein
MQIKYKPKHLTRSEQQLLNIVLAIEVEMQSWYSLAWSETMGELVTIVIQ